jgi:hypothetical protein
MKTVVASALAAAVVAGCATSVPSPEPREVFLDRLQSLCGRSFEGRVTTTDAADAAFAGQRLVMEVRCAGGQIRIPFAVGEDRSRTWVVSRTNGGLRLKHDHRHADGTEDVLSQYGGDTIAPGSPGRQEFPVDAFSQALFTREGRAVSNTNVWALEVHPEQIFAYELRRSGRHFRVEFDLSRPLAGG